MTDILKYYKDYHKSGHYTLAMFKGSSRHLMIEGWLKANLKKGDSVLDIGCGDGSYSEWMPEFKWTGIDINEEKAKYNGTRLVGNVEETPYNLPSDSFNAVICSEVLEHLWSPEKVNQEAHRVLKKGGIYIISTPNFNWIEHVLKGWAQVLYDPMLASHTKEHIRFYDLEGHLKMLSQAGFKPIDFMGADTQFGEFFQMARTELKQAMPEKPDGEIDLLLGKMFRTSSHTLGVMAVKP